MLRARKAHLTLLVYVCSPGTKHMYDTPHVCVREGDFLIFCSLCCPSSSSANPNVVLGDRRYVVFPPSILHWMDCVSPLRPFLFCLDSTDSAARIVRRLNLLSPCAILDTLTLKILPNIRGTESELHIHSRVVPIIRAGQVLQGPPVVHGLPVPPQDNPSFDSFQPALVSISDDYITVDEMIELSSPK